MRTVIAKCQHFGHLFKCVEKCLKGIAKLFQAMTVGWTSMR